MKITLFGLAGVGKGTIGPLLAERLGVPFQSGGDWFREEARIRNLDLSQVEELARTRTDIDRLLDARLREYVAETRSFVLDSRLAWFHAPDSVKIALVCDDWLRVNRVAKRDGIYVFAAAEMTCHREESAVHRFQELYGICGLYDPSRFDLVVDTTGRECLGGLSPYLDDIVDHILERIPQAA
jgi:predicted cytidylate kinase